MRRNLIYLGGWIVAALLVVSCRKSMLPAGGGPPENPPKLVETSPAVLQPVTFTISRNIKGFYQALPARYEESEQEYPVIICFHGGGQYGDGNTELEEVLQDGIPKLLKEKLFPPSFTVNEERHSFIVIAPQLVRSISATEVGILVNYVKENYRVDPRRIYMWGFSLGAQTMYNYLAEAPSVIAAAVGMGGGPNLDTNLETKCRAMAEARLPIWHFHNKDDAAWPYNESRRFIEVVNYFDPVPVPLFTSFDVGQGRLQHDCWTHTTVPEYRENGHNIYEWMLQYTR